MLKGDAEEAAGIAGKVLDAILAGAPTSGRPGADLRTAVGDFKAFALPLIQGDMSGPKLAEIFDLARKTGATLPQLAYVRSVAVGSAPVTSGAVLMKNSLIAFSLATESRVIADTAFKSREAVETMKDDIGAAFDAMQEIAADDMDTPTYRALITLQAAVSAHLLQTQHPLPRMLNFQFAAPGPTLLYAWKLYQDAGRADELREENGVVHPAFALAFGRALAQ
jgi:prophage DNA circulation protein